MEVLLDFRHLRLHIHHGLLLFLPGDQEQDRKLGPYKHQPGSRMNYSANFGQLEEIEAIFGDRIAETLEEAGQHIQDEKKMAIDAQVVEHKEV